MWCKLDQDDVSPFLEPKRELNAGVFDCALDLAFGFLEQKIIAVPSHNLSVCFCADQVELHLGEQPDIDSCAFGMIQKTSDLSR